MTKAGEARIERRTARTGSATVRSMSVPEVQVELSNPAALRAFRALTQFGLAMLMAMVRHVSTGQCDGPTFADAAEGAELPLTDGHVGVHELIDCGILRRTPDGTMVMHPMLSVIGHRLRRDGASEGASYGDNVVRMEAQV